ncbi:carbohydrate-binding domain-containing protein [Neobacillus jeddahensis]|uniref:carbohydrate-binding domain-containing protein n=1 Tax=Neobacillus jeddahensis TaxID=1461580 RepID=UPI000693C8BC|nr:carbohydrate-binding domain-containing protein [Neobacillus jeddahensis]
MEGWSNRCRCHADDGILGRDLVAVKDGKISITAGGDGIKSSNDNNQSKGNIALEDGTFEITAVNDGLQAESSLLIAGGKYSIKTGGGSPETIANRDEGMGMGGPFGGDPSSTTNEETETPSAKGLKAGTEVAIGGGSFTIDAADDAIHSNSSVTIAKGDMRLASGDDGIHGDASIVVKGGKISITKSYEGIESKVVALADGEIQLVAADDGINVGGGKDGSGTEMGMGMDASDDSLMLLTGGNVSVDASGDGLDSNGSIQMTSGTVFVNGPTESFNAPLDYNGSFEMSGGFLIASGSSGMAQTTSEQSQQGGIMMTYPATQTARTLVHLEDSEGKTIATFVPSKDYQTFFISSPDLKKDQSYTLYSGGTATGTEKDGLFTDGDYQGGTKVVDFTITTIITWLNESGVTTGGSTRPGGGPGRGPGQGGGDPSGGSSNGAGEGSNTP